MKSFGYFMLVVGLLVLYILCINWYSEQNTELQKLYMILCKSFHLSAETVPFPEALCSDHSMLWSGNSHHQNSKQSPEIW